MPVSHSKHRPGQPVLTNGKRPNIYVTNEFSFEESIVIKKKKLKGRGTVLLVCNNNQNTNCQTTLMHGINFKAGCFFKSLLSVNACLQHPTTTASTKTVHCSGS